MLADKSYRGAEGAIGVPYRGKWHNLSPGPQAVNRSHARIRALGERAVATLKTWRLLRGLRCSTTRSADLTRAVLEFHLNAGCGWEGLGVCHRICVSKCLEAGVTDVVAVSVSNSAELDVIFLHGLDGDARKSWQWGTEDSFWPEWLAADVGGISVWSVNYDAWSSGWRGRTMSIQDRARNIMASLKTKGIGGRPLVFVAHSMGGLLVKEMLLEAAWAGSEYVLLAEQVKGVVFLGTPHNGSWLTSAVNLMGKLYRGTQAVRDLKSDDPHLRHTATRYRDWAFDHPAVRHLVFFETWKTKGVQVVAAGSADPGLPKVGPVPVDADHVGICKPKDREALVYARTRDFIADVHVGIRTVSMGKSERVASPKETLSGTLLSNLTQIHLLSGRHVVGSLDGPQPAVSIWKDDGSYGLQWALSSRSTLEYSFVVRLDAGIGVVKSWVWVSKTGGDVDFSVRSQGGAIQWKLTPFVTDPDYPYEYRAELSFIPADSSMISEEVFVLTATPETSGRCSLFWGMFYPSAY